MVNYKKIEIKESGKVFILELICGVPTVDVHPHVWFIIDCLAEFDEVGQVVSNKKFSGQLIENFNA